MTDVIAIVPIRKIRTEPVKEVMKNMPTSKKFSCLTGATLQCRERKVQL